MLVGEGARDGDVVKDSIRIDAEAIRDVDYAFGAESTFGVDVHNFSITTATFNRQLSGYAEGMCQSGGFRKKCVECHE